MCSTTMSADILFNIYSLLYYFRSMLLVYKWLLSGCQWTKFWTASDSVAHISNPTMSYRNWCCFQFFTSPVLTWQTCLSIDDFADLSLYHTLSLPYKRLSACCVCSQVPSLGDIDSTYPFLDMFVNPSLIDKDWHCSQLSAILPLMQQSHLSSAHCHLITSLFASAHIYLNWEYWPHIHFQICWWKLPTLPSFIKTGTTLSLWSLFYWYSRVTFPVHCHLITSRYASAHIYLNWEYWPHITSPF